MTSFSDIFKFVLKNMFEKKGRVLLTVSGIVIGIFTFIFFVFASQGLSNAISGQFTAFGVNVLIVRSADSSSGGPPGGGGLTDTDIENIKKVARGYKYVAPFIFHTGLYEYGRSREVIVSLAYPDKYWDDVGSDIGIEMEKGRFLRQGDRGVVVVGDKVSKDGFGEGNEIIVGSSIKAENRSFRVIGIIKNRGDLFVDNSILLTFDDIKKVSGQDTYGGIRVSFLEGVDLDEQRNAIERKLNPNSREKNIEITSPNQAIEQFNSILGVLRMIILFVSSIALVVGGINVMNTMYSNILERINEISVMKALGGTNSDIRNMFLIESSILGFIGAFVGFMLAYGLAELLSYLITNFGGYNVPVNFSFELFIYTMLITTFFAMLFGTYPAIRASYVDPADNLRDE